MLKPYACASQADELRDRLSDVDRTNSDASAQDMAGMTADAPASSTTRFGAEAAGGTSSLRPSTSSLKRMRELEEAAPLALHLDHLAGPAPETSLRTDRGVTEVRQASGMTALGAWLNRYLSQAESLCM